MLGALLSEFRGLWRAPQHAATAQLLSSVVFSIREPGHAAKLRANMQWLVADPPPGECASLLFVMPAGAVIDAETGPAQRRAVGVAAEAQIELAAGNYPDS